jgi:ribulose 1,5-bisphosphate synthetase/thiazole synthase
VHADSNVPEIVTRVQGPSVDYDLGSDSKIFDVLVCGGTLGIFIATALSYKGLRVGIIERNIIKGVIQPFMAIPELAQL